jgi:23S rRNA pseudouridine1911/1915/1917 synthase
VAPDALDLEESSEDDELLETLSFDVSSEDRLDRFLVSQLETLDAARRAGTLPGTAILASRALVQRWIDEGRVRIGLRPLKKNTKVRPGERVLVDVPPPAPPVGPLEPEAIPVPIIHQDDEVLVLDKPAGLTVHPGAGQRTGTLANALLHATGGKLSHLGGDDRPGIVHRLDKDTSGLIICARTDRAHRFLSLQFHDRKVDKRYVAILDGVPREERGTIDAPIGRSLRDRKKMAVRKDGEGRHAVTHWQVLERFKGHAFVELRIETGRTHQIRVHMASIGCPVLADATYGRGVKLRDEKDQVLIGRQALHARSMRIAHPDKGELSFEAPLPPDMVRTLAWLRRPEG